MHDSEQEHSGITGCRVTYESTIFYNEANKFSIIVVKTSDPRIPPQACSGRYYGDRMLRFTAVGYELPRTKAVELELDGEWVESKYGYQLQVEQWQEIVPQTVCWHTWVPGLSRASVPRQQRTLLPRSDRTP